MAFYFLHPYRKEAPKSEKDYDYLLYSENKPTARLKFNFNEDVFCPHPSNGDKSWSFDDEIIDLVARNDRSIILAQFKKVYDETGYTIWKNTSL